MPDAQTVNDKSAESKHSSEVPKNKNPLLEPGPSRGHF